VKPVNLLNRLCNVHLVRTFYIIGLSEVSAMPGCVAEGLPGKHKGHF
jgi:hypothetical protein